MKEALRVYFQYEKMDYEETWILIRDVLESLGFQMGNYHRDFVSEFSEKESRIKNVLKYLFQREWHDRSAHICDGHLQFEVLFDRLAESETDGLTIYINKHDFNWDVLVKKIYTQSQFIYACLLNRDYFDFQNTYEFNDLKNLGYDTSNLSLYDHPSIKGRVRVDVSKNPSNENFQDGYIAMIGSRMWLGKHFWGFSAATPEAVLAAPWLHAKQLTKKVIQILVQDSCFNSDSGAERELQERLRGFLFPPQPTEVSHAPLVIPQSSNEELATINQKYIPSNSEDLVIVQDIKKAAKWISLALQSSGYQADFSVQSLNEVERFFCEHSKDGKAVPGGLLSEDLGKRIFGLGAYVGEVLRQHAGGDWFGNDDDPYVELDIVLRLANGMSCQPMQRVLKRFQSELNGIGAYGAAILERQ
jgi:hypothetical protein